MSGRYALNLPVDLKQDAEQVAQQQGISLNQLILWSLAEKVTALKSKMDDPQFPDITYKMDAQGYPVPILRGKGLRVQTIVIAANVWNEPAMEIAQEYDLSERLVKEALSFYEAHKKMLDALIELNDEAEKNHV
jgi:uncharacterized protein (DUF433 family)